MTENAEKINNLKKLKLIIGSILFIFIVLMYAFYDVELWLVVVPGILMGIDPYEFIPNKK